MGMYFRAYGARSVGYFYASKLDLFSSTTLSYNFSLVVKWVTSSFPFKPFSSVQFCVLSTSTRLCSHHHPCPDAGPLSHETPHSRSPAPSPHRPTSRLYESDDSGGPISVESCRIRVFVMASFTQHVVRRVRPCCSRVRNAFPFYLFIYVFLYC